MYLKKLDWLLIISVLILCAISSLTLFSQDAGIQTSNFFVKQILFIFLGLVVMIVLSFLDCRIFRNYSSVLIALYAILLALLGLVLVFGHKIRGTVGWFSFGEFNFEPVELAKIVVILILAKYFSGRHVEVYRMRHVIASGVYMALPLVLVLMQPDLGSAFILIAVWLGITVMSGMKFRHLLIVLIIGAIGASLAWGFAFKPYQKERILTFLNPAKDPLGYSYNLNQSKIAIGSGGFLGKGLGRGTQGQFNFLPEKHTDFIFAAIAEEWGLIGVVFLFAAYLMFFWRLMKLIFASGNNFFRLFIAGFGVMIFAQVLINVGMNLGLLPIAGISLPFVSYGGSNLLINFIALGIIQNIAVQIKSSAIRITEKTNVI